MLPVYITFFAFTSYFAKVSSAHARPQRLQRVNCIHESSASASLAACMSKTRAREDSEENAQAREGASGPTTVR